MRKEGKRARSCSHVSPQAELPVKAPPGGTRTALHWGAKHGNEHVVKLIAGTYGADVNARTGYTPAHIAMQFGHEAIFNLLVQVYYADPNLRDWSGRKPRQYQTSQDTAVSADTFRSEYTQPAPPEDEAESSSFERNRKTRRSVSNPGFLRKSMAPTTGAIKKQPRPGPSKTNSMILRYCNCMLWMLSFLMHGDGELNVHLLCVEIKARKKHSEKDLGFLRIGSLNVRVKRTTEAFSNFLGVGSNSDKLHKTWGSADNIQQVDRRIMPPPKVAPIKKHRSRRPQDFSGSHSTPSTPPSQSRTRHLPGQNQDSDSDTACGFGNDWQNTT
ncbi:uncharacterized protein [Anabrus simplex]|uniref:uncharacterized protein n=1 Tax=Anabrus simplex TaxID=316456 RepID=UPI0035A31F0E